MSGGILYHVIRGNVVVRTRQLTTEDFHLIGRATLSAAPTTGLVTKACQTINFATQGRNEKLSDF
jgi:hypothetical protein